MSFDSTVKKLQKKFFVESTVNAEGFENFGVTVHLTDDKNEGRFYIAVTDGQFRIEPFNYEDRACEIELAATVLNSIVSGKTTIAEAYEKGKLTYKDNFDYALKVQELISKAVSAEAAKKETAPKAEKHAAPKAAAKTEEKPAVKESPKAEVKEASKAEVKAEVKEAPKADAKAPKAPHPRKAKRNK